MVSTLRSFSSCFLVINLLERGTSLGRLFAEDRSCSIMRPPRHLSRAQHGVEHRNGLRYFFKATNDVMKEYSGHTYIYVTHLSTNIEIMACLGLVDTVRCAVRCEDTMRCAVRCEDTERRALWYQDTATAGDGETESKITRVANREDAAARPCRLCNRKHGSLVVSSYGLRTSQFVRQQVWREHVRSRQGG